MFTFRRLGLNYYFALVKSKKITKKFNVNAIADKFGVNVQQAKTEAEAIEKYMKFWEQPNFNINNFSFFKLYQAEHANQSVQFTKAQIASRYPSYNQQAQTAINNFYRLWANLGLAVLKNDVGGLDSWKRNIVLLNIVQTVNQFFHLSTPNKQNCLLLINFTLQIKSSFRNFPLLDFTAAYRKAIDSLMGIGLEEYSQQQILQVFRNLSILNIHYWYYQNSLKVIKYFLSGIDQNWQSILLGSRVKLINSVQKLGVYNKQIVEKSMVMLASDSYKIKDLQKLYCLKYLISIGKIGAQNIHQYDALIKHFLENKDRKVMFFNDTVNHFYRAALWHTEYWVSFFNYMEANADPNTIDGFQVYSIFQLIDLFKAQIDPAIVQACQRTKNSILKNYPTLDVESLKKDYDDKYTSEAMTRVNCQSQIANCLRLFRHGNVRTQVFIYLFNVDILIEDKYVVQINGGSHYIYDLDNLNSLQFNLKTNYRNRVLTKLGYIVINVNLSNFGEASFDLVQRIMQIIKENRNSGVGKVQNIVSG